MQERYCGRRSLHKKVVHADIRTESGSDWVTAEPGALSTLV